MEDVRAVGVHEDTGIVVSVIGVAANVGTLVDDENALAGGVGKSFGKDAPREARADDQIVEHGVTRYRRCCGRLEALAAFVHLTSR